VHERGLYELEGYTSGTSGRKKDALLARGREHIHRERVRRGDCVNHPFPGLMGTFQGSKEKGRGNFVRCEGGEGRLKRKLSAANVLELLEKKGATREVGWDLILGEGEKGKPVQVRLKRGKLGWWRGGNKGPPVSLKSSLSVMKPHAGIIIFTFWVDEKKEKKGSWACRGILKGLGRAGSWPLECRLRLPAQGKLQPCYTLS